MSCPSASPRMPCCEHPSVFTWLSPPSTASAQNEAPRCQGFSTMRTFHPSCRQRKEPVGAFYQQDGPSALTWFYQTPPDKPAGSPAALYLGSPQVHLCMHVTTLPHAEHIAAVCFRSFFPSGDHYGMTACTCLANDSADENVADFTCAGEQREVLANKAVYFVRINAKGVGEATPEADIAMGQVCCTGGPGLTTPQHETATTFASVVSS